MNKIVFSELEKKVLSTEQISLVPLLEEFSKTHLLAGGTAIALYLHHRKSIDFDLFCFGKQGTGKELFQRVKKTGFVLDENSFFPYLSKREESELEFWINGVKVQIIDFSRNPFGVSIKIKSKGLVGQGIKTPSLEDLACLKLYAMMYRKKWKDAVDLYFLIKTQNFDLALLLENTKKIFKKCYKLEASLETILENKWDKTEGVDYVIKTPPADKEVGEFLINLVKIYLKNA